jgi:hypothetical protein
VSRVSATLGAALRTLEETSRYGELESTSADGTKVYCDSPAMMEALGSWKYADADCGPMPELSALTHVSPDGRVTRYELGMKPSPPDARGHNASAVSPVDQPRLKREVPAWALSESTPKPPEPAPATPTVRPKSEGDPEVFVHTVRAGLGERRQLALTLMDSSERCRLLPRFAELFAEWSRQLWDVYDGQPADVVLRGDGFGWGHKTDRAELERLLRIARDRQAAPSPSMMALHRAAAIAFYGPDGNPMPIERETYRHRDDDDGTSTLQRMTR